jgi:hypothetical protein
MQPQAVQDQGQTIARSDGSQPEPPRILQLGYGAAQVQENGSYKLLPLFVIENSGIVLAPINGAKWAEQFYKKADAPVEGE